MLIHVLNISFNNKVLPKCRLFMLKMFVILRLVKCCQWRKTMHYKNDLCYIFDFFLFYIFQVYCHLTPAPHLFFSAVFVCLYVCLSAPLSLCLCVLCFDVSVSECMNVGLFIGLSFCRCFLDSFSLF